MSLDTVRALSRSYAAGTLDVESYRAKRRELIKKIADGEMPAIPYKQPEPQTKTVFPEEDEGDKTLELYPPLRPEAGSKSKHKLLLGLGVLAVVILALAVYFFVRGNNTMTMTPSPNTPLPDTVAPAVPNVLDDFLTANNWQTGALETLGSRWQSLTPQARLELQSSEAMSRLNEAVLARFVEENALIGLGDAEEARATQDALLTLAETLGLRNERIANARRQWRESAPAKTAETDIEKKKPLVAEPAANTNNVQTAATDLVEAKPDTASTTAAADATAAAPSTAAEITPSTDDKPETPVTTAAVSTPSAVVPEPIAAETANKAGGDSKVRTGARTNCKAALAGTRRPYCIDVFADGTKGPALVVLKPGSFTIGEGQDTAEVSVSDHFAIGMFEISAAELSEFCTAREVSCPAQPWPDPALPAVNLSWNMAQEFTAWLSSQSGAQYRLPSEAEWEYAARAGLDSRYPNGDELLPTHARFSFKGKESAPLAANDRSLNRNNFRLYHMLGNVREWVSDVWHPAHNARPADSAARSGSGNERVVRGGSYEDRADRVHFAARLPLAATASDQFTGFRVVRELTQP